MTKDSAQNLEAPGDNYEADERVEDQDTNQVEVINIASQTVRFEIDGNRYVLRPGQTCSLHKSYALARKTAKNRDAIPSVVEMLTSKQVLSITDPRAAGVGRR